MALKKKYPGKLFIEAANEKAIKDSLQGFIDVNVARVTPMDHEFYSSLFEAKENKEVQYKMGQFVRIKRGVYESDLGKIARVKKANIDVVLVPRINTQDILAKMREEATKTYTDRELIEKKD
jgi:transcription antitermination factor NusG